jgi:hypothetical protein
VGKRKWEGGRGGIYFQKVYGILVDKARDKELVLDSFARTCEIIIMRPRGFVVTHY